MATLTVEREEEGARAPLHGALPLRVLENPFSLMRRFSHEMDRLFEDFGFRPRFFETTVETAVWAPNVEVLAKEGKLIVRADLPGLTKDDVKVGVTDDVLTLEGERKQEKEEKREGYFRSERSYGAFYRAIPLPEGVKADGIVANFKNGVLEVAMPLVKEEEQGQEDRSQPDVAFGLPGRRASNRSSRRPALCSRLSLHPNDQPLDQLSADTRWNADK